MRLVIFFFFRYLVVSSGVYIFIWPFPLAEIIFSHLLRYAILHAPLIFCPFCTYFIHKLHFPSLFLSLFLFSIITPSPFFPERPEGWGGRAQQVHGAGQAAHRQADSQRGESQAQEPHTPHVWAILGLEDKPPARIRSFTEHQVAASELVLVDDDVLSHHDYFQGLITWGVGRPV